MASRRLRVPAFLLLVYLGALAVIWTPAVSTRQYLVLATIATSLVALLAVVVWFVAGSGLTRQTRVAGMLALLSVVLAGVLLFRLDVTGDLRPVLRYRFAADPSPVLEPEIEPDILRFISTAGDSPQFLGPRRDGSLRIRLDTDWDLHPPEELWRRQIGAGWGSFAVVGRVAITQEQRGDEEALIAYTVDTGEIVWAYNYPARYTSAIAGIGPRATPTIWGDTVWAMGSTGILNAVELFTGKLRWSKNVIDDQGGRLQEWGKSSSPLVYEDLVIVTGGWGGPTLVAYDRMTGALRWRADAGRPDYASPVLATIAGREQIVIFNAASLSAHDPRTGDLLWTTPWPPGQPTVAQPLVIGDLVLASSGYGRGAKLFAITRRGRRFEVTTLWESPRLKAKFAHFVKYEDFVYGLDDGVLTCIDPSTGQRVWKGGRYGHGQLLISAGLLLIQAEDGSLVLVEATPDEHRELHRLPVLNGKTWNVPTRVGDVLLLRNDREAVALRLPLRTD